MTTVRIRFYARKLQSLSIALRRVTVLAGVGGALVLAAGQASADPVTVQAFTPVTGVVQVSTNIQNPCDWPWPNKP
jgi:hypothetical protein